MSLHYFDLPKLPETVSAEDSQKLWLALFSAETEEELKQIEALGGIGYGTGNWGRDSASVELPRPRATVTPLAFALIYSTHIVGTGVRADTNLS